MNNEYLLERFYHLLEFIKDENYVLDVISDLFTYLNDKEKKDFITFTIDEIEENYNLQETSISNT